MKDIGKIAGFNILFILVYDIILRLGSDHTSSMFISMFLVAGQTILNFILAIVFYSTNKSPTANSFLLTTFLVLIIGFGVCVSHFT
jgi:hypothetical protein